MYLLSTCIVHFQTRHAYMAHVENEGPNLNWNSRRGAGRHPSLTDCVKNAYVDRYFPGGFSITRVMNGPDSVILKESPGILSLGNTDNFIRASAW